MTVLFAGGGTGGHLYPAIAMAEALRERDPGVRIAFAGTSGKIEARVVPARGYEFHAVWISGFSRRLTAANLLFPVKVAVSLVQSFFLIRRLRPSVVVGTGGYVCGPVLFMSSWLGVPSVVHESNSYPGVTTRLLAKRMTRVFITFDATRRWLPAGSTAELVGNPTRDELSRPSREEACAHFGLDPAKETLFVFGGSLGAASINRAMPAVVRDAVASGRQVIWQTGESDASSSASVAPHPSVKVFPFVERMDLGYAAADLVVCRAGATTLAELTRLGKPAVLVPYPHAAANHQELNAKAMVDAGAAVMVTDDALGTELLPAVQRMLNGPAARSAMSAKSLALGRPEAGRVLAEKITALAR